MCDEPIVLPYASLSIMSFEIMTGEIVVVAFYAKCVFAPESAIDSIFLLV